MGPGKIVHYKEVLTPQGCSLLEVSLCIQYGDLLKLKQGDVLFKTQCIQNYASNDNL